MARKPADQSVNPQAILVAAADVLRRKGYESTTMKDIAAEVNLTAASLYHHFKNKDMLLLAVMEAGIELVISRIEPVVQAEQASADKLREMICAHVVSLTENTAVGAAMVFEIRALLANGVHDEEFLQRRAEFFQKRDHFESLFRQVIQAGIERGEFRAVDVPIFTKTLLGAHNWVGVWYRDGGRLSGAEIAERMAETFLHSLQE